MMWMGEGPVGGRVSVQPSSTPSEPRPFRLHLFPPPPLLLSPLPGSLPHPLPSPDRPQPIFDVIAALAEDDDVSVRIAAAAAISPLADAMTHVDGRAHAPRLLPIVNSLLAAEDAPTLLAALETVERLIQRPVRSQDGSVQWTLFFPRLLVRRATDIVVLSMTPPRVTVTACLQACPRASTIYVSHCPHTHRYPHAHKRVLTSSFHPSSLCDAQRLERALEPNWRHLHALLATFSALLPMVEPHVLHAQLLPLVLKHTAAAAAPNRQAAARILCQLLRRLPTAAQRADVTGRLLADFGEGPNYASRLLFLHVCKLLLDATGPAGCSRAFFKANGFHEQLLALATDGARPPPQISLRPPHTAPRTRPAPTAHRVAAVSRRVSSPSDAPPDA